MYFYVNKLQSAARQSFCFHCARPCEQSVLAAIASMQQVFRGEVCACASESMPVFQWGPFPLFLLQMCP